MTHRPQETPKVDVLILSKALQFITADKKFLSACNFYSVIGVELFNGKFYFCTDESRMTKETCVGEMVILHLDHAEVESREWQRHDFHFDNVIDAFLSLFTFSTGAGWPDGMWASIESTQELFHAHS